MGSMMAASMKALQFISVTVLKIIFKQYSGKAENWTYGLDAQTLDAWTLGHWTLGLRTTGHLDSGCWESGRLDVRTLDVWALDTRPFELWTPGRSDFGRLDAYIKDDVLITTRLQRKDIIIENSNFFLLQLTDN